MISALHHHYHHHCLSLCFKLKTRSNNRVAAFLYCVWCAFRKTQYLKSKNKNLFDIGAAWMEALILASQRVVAFRHFNSNPWPLTSICARCDLLWGGRSARQWILKIRRCPSRLPGILWSHWHLFFLRTTLISWAHRVNYWAWDIQQGWDITTSWTLFLADCGVSAKVK